MASVGDGSSHLVCVTDLATCCAFLFIPHPTGLNTMSLDDLQGTALYTSNDCSGDAPHAAYLCNFWWHQEDSSSIYSYPFNLSVCSPPVSGFLTPAPGTRSRTLLRTCLNLSSRCVPLVPIFFILGETINHFGVRNIIATVNVVTKIIESHYLFLMLFLNTNCGYQGMGVGGIRLMACKCKNQ